MNIYHLIAIFGLVLSQVGCSTRTPAAIVQEKPKPEPAKEEPMQIANEYENEFGKIKIVNKEGSKLAFVVTDNDKSSRGFIMRAGIETASTENSGCVVEVKDNQLIVKGECDQTPIEQFLTRPFFVLDSNITIEGDILVSKAGATIEGIYLKDYQGKTSMTAVKVQGIIQKEPYPRAYYSTHESPQGMFPDDGKVRYRLILENYIISPIKQ